MSEKIVIIGAGGHAKVVADCINSAGHYTILGCLSADRDQIGGLNVIGGDELIPKLIAEGQRIFFVAIGDNNIRSRVMAKLQSMGAMMPVVRHPSSVVSTSANIEAGSVVMPGAVINSDVSIGFGCIVNTLSGIDHDCVLSDCVHVGPGSAVAGSVRIGSMTFIGAGSTIIPGIEIGSRCIVGAGSVVIRDIPSLTKSLGVPARTIAEL